MPWRNDLYRYCTFVCASFFLFLISCSNQNEQLATTDGSATSALSEEATATTSSEYLGPATSLLAKETDIDEPTKSSTTGGSNDPAPAPRNESGKEIQLTLNAATGSTYWVSPDGQGVSTSETAPGNYASTLEAVCSSINGGDVIILKDGTYRGHNFQGKNCDQSGKYITIKAETPRAAKIQPFGYYFRCSSFFIIDGLEFSGSGGDASDPYRSAINILGYASGEGKPSCGPVSHHIVAKNNYIHDLPSAGLNTQYATHIVFENNTIFNTSPSDPYQTSAISFYGHENLENYPPLPGGDGYSNIIRNNRVWNTKNTVQHPSSGKITDGNCIIIDVNNERGHYTPRTLVKGNVCTNNARGVNILTSSHIDIIDNVFYHNQNHSSDWPEVSIFCDSRGRRVEDIHIVGNVVVPTPGSPSIDHRIFGDSAGPRACPLSSISDIHYVGNIFVDNLNTSNLNKTEFQSVTFPTSTDASDIKACKTNITGISLAELGFINVGEDESANFGLQPDSILKNRNCQVNN